ncbi:hypothetical protein jhhlp_006677 [Lomentospora prolificans]|uniref:Uncharacterized protein n=1 Tax=Lomentospora prolificans TaxID=41688 RepID=A0A2N3N6K4_9PEZI|nr:hypothetical protein jhhlp_006677 [Lomentospora prolificans]
MDVGEGAGRRLERFEWRRSHGQEVKSVGQSSWGWKLVRLGAGGAEADDQVNYDDEGPLTRNGLTSDGKEVVAVWADSNSWKSISKVGELQFLSSGASGELGIRWSLMALMSCLCMWQKMMQNSVASSAAAVAS